MNKNLTAGVLARRAFYELQEIDYQKALAHAAARMIMCQITGQAREGMAAALEKRKPIWSIKSTGKNYTKICD